MIVLRRFSVALVGHPEMNTFDYGARVVDKNVAGDDTVRRFRGPSAYVRARSLAVKLNRMNAAIVRLGVARDAHRGVAS